MVNTEPHSKIKLLPPGEILNIAASTFFGKRKADTIKVKDIESYLNWRSNQISRKTKGQISRDTINMELIVLKTIFKRPVKADILLNSPVADIRLLAKIKG